MATKKWIRDIIHDYIQLNPIETGIIDTKIFQRLRNISMTALASYTYPSLRGSRFEHSIGTMKFAGRMIEVALDSENPYVDEFLKQCGTTFLDVWKKQKLAPPLDLTPLLSEDSSEEEKKEIKRKIKALIKEVVRFTALLHDIGHLPFSHTGEEALSHELLQEILSEEDYRKFNKELKLGYHEFATIKLIENNPELHKCLPEKTRCLITAILKTTDPTDPLYALKEIVSGDMDADRGDSILRDGAQIGAEIGHYDVSRMNDHLRIYHLKKEELLFSVDLTFQSDLDSKRISEALHQEFENNGIELSGNATGSIEEEGSKWLISDNIQTYTVRKEENRLNIYKEEFGYERFIIRPGKYSLSAIEAFLTERYNLRKWVYYHHFTKFTDSAISHVLNWLLDIGLRCQKEEYRNKKAYATIGELVSNELLPKDDKTGRSLSRFHYENYTLNDLPSDDIWLIGVLRQVYEKLCHTRIGKSRKLKKIRILLKTMLFREKHHISLWKEPIDFKKFHDGYGNVMRERLRAKFFERFEPIAIKERGKILGGKLSDSTQKRLDKTKSLLKEEFIVNALTDSFISLTNVGDDRHWKDLESCINKELRDNFSGLRVEAIITRLKLKPYENDPMSRRGEPEPDWMLISDTDSPNDVELVRMDQSMLLKELKTVWERDVHLFVYMVCLDEGTSKVEELSSHRRQLQKIFRDAVIKWYTDDPNKIYLTDEPPKKA